MNTQQRASWPVRYDAPLWLLFWLLINCNKRSGGIVIHLFALGKASRLPGDKLIFALRELEEREHISYATFGVYLRIQLRMWGDTDAARSALEKTKTAYRRGELDQLGEFFIGSPQRSTDRTLWLLISQLKKYFEDHPAEQESELSPKKLSIDEQLGLALRISDQPRFLAS